ncbi:hypothetical protein [Variovorax sp.]|uniref:hypothetical protein n=1 Tax=Variovorax sp. TaxID=1871043 RepID=UPI002D31B527|nr:hypothetical protein [Variovorax sp.]HYP85449.1 hypothetical protein [Variovorax sp.]
MRKLLSLAMAGLFVTGAAYAQTNPPGSAAPPHTPGMSNSQAQQAGEMHKNMRSDQPVNPPGGDMPKSPEAGKVQPDKAESNADQRVMKRDQMKPGEPAPMQGGTPKQ